MPTIQQFETTYLVIMAVLAAVIVLIAVVRRRFGRNLRYYYHGDTTQPVYHSVGTAFLALHAMAQPQMEHVLEERLAEETEKDEDDEGGPEKAGRGQQP